MNVSEGLGVRIYLRFLGGLLQFDSEFPNINCQTGRLVKTNYENRGADGARGDF